MAGHSSGNCSLHFAVVLTVNSQPEHWVEAGTFQATTPMPTRERQMRPVSIAVYALACLTAAWIAGCATERLAAAAPKGVNLTGEWKFNPNLSDDPDKLPDPDKAPQRAPGSHRGHGGGRGGGGGGMGMPPMGSGGGTGDGFAPAVIGFTPAASSFMPAASGFTPAAIGFTPAADGRMPAGARGGFLPVALTAPGIEQATPLPAAGAPATGATTTRRGVSINRLLKPPVHVSITQKEASLVIKADMPDGTHTADEYTAGTSNTIPYGPNGTADRSVGWRGPVFVVTTAAKKGGWREDDFALDDDGRLIITTETKGGRLGTLEITRVYDRVRGAEAQ